MHDVEAKNHPTQSEVQLKSFNARQALDYPAYSMVICQVIDKLKLVLTRRVKITVNGMLALVFCPLQSDTEMK